MDKYAQLASLFTPAASAGTSELDKLFGLRPITDEELAARRADRDARIAELLGEERGVGPSGAAKIPELGGDTKAQLQWAKNYLESQGLPSHLAAGALGNVMAESGGRTGAVGDSGASVGAFQWQKERLHGGGGYTGLLPYAQSVGASPYDLKTQLDYFLHELKGPEQKALQQALNTRTPEEAAAAFAKYYERPAGSDYSKRMAYARQIAGGAPIQSPAGSPADQLLPPDQQAQPQIDMSQFEPIMLSNQQQAYMEKGLTLEEAAKRLKEMNIDAIPMRQFDIKSDTPVYVPYDANDEEALGLLRKKNPEILKAAGLPTDTSAWGAYKQQLTSGLGQLGVAGGIGLEALGAEQAGKYLQEKGRAMEEESKGMFTQPTPEEAGPVMRHFGIPLAQGAAGLTTVAPALMAGPAAGLVGAGLISGAQEYGALEQKAREEGTPFEKVGALAPAAAIGAINSLADRALLPFFKIASSGAGVASGKAIRELVDSEGADVAKQKIGSYVGDMLKNAGMAEASGASADIASHLIEKTYQDKPIGTEETWNEIKDILAQGAPTYLTLGALGGAGEQYTKRTELQKIKEQDVAEAKLAEQKQMAEARLEKRLAGEPVEVPEGEIPEPTLRTPDALTEEVKPVPAPVSYEDLELKGKNSKVLMRALKDYDIENPEHGTVINQMLDQAETLQHNPEAVQAIRTRLQEVQDAQQISGASTPDGRSGAQPILREEGRDQAISGEGMEPSRQGLEAPEIRREEVKIPEAEEVVVPEDLASARQRLRGQGLASEIVEPTFGEKAGQVASNLFAEGRKPNLRVEVVDKSAPLRNIDKELPSMVGGQLHPAMQAGHIAQAGNLISRSVAEGTPVMSANGMTEIKPNDATAPLKVYKKAADAGRAKEVNEALVAMRYFDFERQADAKQAQANSYLQDAENLRKQAAEAATPKDAQKLKIQANQAEAKGNKLLEQVEPLRAKQRTVITPEQAKTAKYVYDNDADVKAAVDGVYGHLQGLLKYLHDADVITTKQYEDYAANVNYFPFHKDTDFEAMLQDPYTHMQAAFSQMGSAGKTIPSIKRQERHAHEIFAEKNVLKQTAWAINTGMQNKHRLNALDTMEAYGSAEYVDPKFKSDKDVVQVRRKGVPEYYRVKDPDLFAALNVAGPSLSPFFKTWGKATGAIRSGMLLTPKYLVGQPLRESLTATIVGRGAAVTPLDAAKELTKILAGKSETYEKLKNKGILSSPDVISDPAAFVREVGNPSGIQKIGKNIQHLYEMLDGAVRDVLYDKEYASAIKRGMTPEEADNLAASRARDITNFSVQGRNQTIRNLKATTPFFNAAIQSLDVLARAAFPRTLGKLSKGEAMEARRLFYSRVAFLAAYSTAYAVMMSDNEDYLKSKDRPLNLLFPNPAGDEDHPLVKIGAVPYEAGFFAKVIPETLTLMNMGKISSERAAKELKSGAYDLLVSGLVPTVYLIQPLIENAINHSFHFGTPIESEAGLSEEFRNRRASELTKAIYEKLNENGIKIPLAESPDKLENLARSYGTQYWTLVKSMGDAYLRNRASGPVAPEKGFMDQPYAKDFFPTPKRTTESEDFYEIREKSNQIMDDLHKAENIHNQEMYEKIKQLPDAEKLFNANPALAEDSKKLAEIDSKIREVTDSKDPALTAKRKAEIIKDWEHQKQAIYSRANVEMRKAGLLKE